MSDTRTLKVNFTDTAHVLAWEICGLAFASIHTEPKRNARELIGGFVGLMRPQFLDFDRPVGYLTIERQVRENRDGKRVAVPSMIHRAFPYMSEETNVAGSLRSIEPIPEWGRMDLYFNDWQKFRDMLRIALQKRYLGIAYFIDERTEMSFAEIDLEVANFKDDGSPIRSSKAIQEMGRCMDKFYKE